jgi:peptidoglycan/xylan/chitin deacetylase (PgdA/CDA1 family)
VNISTSTHSSSRTQPESDRKAIAATSAAATHTEKLVGRLEPCNFPGPPGEVNPESYRPGALVISLDFELHWGVRDRAPLDWRERARLLAARSIVPRLLDLFEEFSVHATWATVGFLFARSREEAQAFMPARKPHYRESSLDPYQERVGRDEVEDPFHFAPTLIAEIAKRPGQEIGCHSFSHYYCIEEGQTADEFEADLTSAVAIAASSGYAMRSYVFPRNEVNTTYLPLLKRAGIRTYRGTESPSTKRPGPYAEQRRLHKRLARLLDSYADLYGSQTLGWPETSTLTSVAASRYLRPYSAALGPLQGFQCRRITQAIKLASRQGKIFHLWWHPEDFAMHCEENLFLLRSVLATFNSCRSEYGMVSLSMAEIGEDQNNARSNLRTVCERTQ